MRVSASQFRISQRAQPTNAEEALWLELRNRQLGGYKFTRQMTIGQFTADFVCRTRILVVELDGPEHENSQHDVIRTRQLNEQGYSVVRFWNKEVLTDRLNVMQAILELLEGHPSNFPELNFSPGLPPERVR